MAPTSPERSRSRRRLLLSTCGALAIAGWPLRPPAQGLSTRPIRIIVAQTPGTVPDLLSRTLAPRLQARWNQPFIVENRAGAAGVIGLEAAQKAVPDGHTININPSSVLTIPIFFPKSGVDVVSGFTPITLLAQNIFALTVHPGVPANDLRTFLAWAKSRAGQVNYGSPGNGTHHHLIMEQLKLQTGLDITHVPYKGSAQAFSDLLGGQITAMFLPMGVVLNYAREGKVRILGGSARERSPLTPDIASLHEQGVSGFHAEGWFSAWGPPGLPADIVAKYNTTFQEVLAETEVRESLAKQGVSVRTSTAEELARLNKAEFESLAKVIRDAKIRAD